MLIQDTLTPVNGKEAASQEPIRNDEVAEEVFAVRLYSKRLTRTAVVALSILCVILASSNYNLAMRPAKRIYIKIDQFNRATAIKYSDLEHYTPDAAVAKNYLADWATFRYERLRATILKKFPKNYLFLESKFGKQIRDRDTKDNVVANVLAGKEPENAVEVVSTNITSYGKQSLEDSIVQGGTADITLYKTFTKDGEVYRQTWTIAIRFYINPEGVEKQSQDNPEYQTINPLGLVIGEFYANRPNIEPPPVKQ